MKNHLLNKFSIPTFCADQQIDNKLIFPNKTIGLLGSTIIKNKDLSVINKSQKVILPVLQSGEQVSVFNPKNDGSNFRLNYTALRLFENNAAGSGDAEFAEYFKTKFETNFNLNNQQRSQISIGAGKFENQLAKFFEKILDGNLASFEFEPIYNLWTEYAKGTVTSSDSIIYSFDGMCFFASKGVDKTEEFDYTAEVSSSGKFPFLSYGLNASSKWVSSDKFTSQKNIYQIYMFQQPVLAKVPSPEDILRAWKKLTPSGKSVTYSSNTLQQSSPLILKVKFGPIANRSIFPLITLDEDYSLNQISNKFIKTIKLINDDETRITSNGNGYYTFDVELYRDEDFIANQLNKLGEITTTEIALRIYIDKPVASQYLEKIYDRVKIQTERHPTPTVSSYDLESTKNGNEYKYVTRVKFSSNSADHSVGTNPRPPRVIEVFGLPTTIDEPMKAAIKAGSFSLKANNEFDFAFSLYEPSSFFSINKRSYEVELLLEFFAGNTTNVTKRKLPVRIVGPQDAFETANVTTDILIQSNTQLLTVLNRDMRLDDKRKLGDVIDTYKQNETIDVLSLIEELKKLNLINVTGENYLVSSRIVNIRSLGK